MLGTSLRGGPCTRHAGRRSASRLPLRHRPGTTKDDQGRSFGAAPTLVTAAVKPRGPAADAAQLLDSLTTAGASTQELSQLVDRISAASSPFKEELLGGGPWVVLFTKGAPLLWNITYQPARLLRPSNRAAQDLDPGSRTVVNSAEYFGGQVYVTASGAYEPRDTSRTTPKIVDVTISSGKLHLFGLDIPLPIRGKGSFEVCFLDPNIRIFRSSFTTYSVQVRQAYLEQLSGV